MPEMQKQFTALIMLLSKNCTVFPKCAKSANNEVRLGNSCEQGFSPGTTLLQGFFPIQEKTSRTSAGKFRRTMLKGNGQMKPTIKSFMARSRC